MDLQIKNKKEAYMGKKMQIEIHVYKQLEEPSHQWLKCNINSAKVGSIIKMLEQVIETKAWKRLVVDTDHVVKSLKRPCTSPLDVRCYPLEST